ncbi:hypothetical protein [Paenibacillus sp. y28]|uniref:hypothetical protein n=1 Tax=Paenibacillus sp. y28 TaxID=3129110 RepID=UPI003018B8DA
MKTVMSPRQLCMSGKARDIRQQLARWFLEEQAPELPLSAFLDKRSMFPAASCRKSTCRKTADK